MKRNKFSYSQDDAIDVVNELDLAAMGISPVGKPSAPGDISKLGRASELLTKARSIKPKP